MPRKSGQSGRARAIWFQPICGIFSPGCAGEPDHLAAKDAQPGGATVEFLAPLKERLIAHANPQKRLSAADKLPDRSQQILFLHGIDAIVEGAHAGEHQGAGGGDFFRAAHDAHLAARLEQRLLHAAQIAGIVVNESDHFPP